MRVVVHRQPLLGGRGQLVPPGVAAQVQPRAAPVACGQYRHLDLRPVRVEVAVVIIAERMVSKGLSEVEAPFGELPVGEGVVAADQLAGARVAAACLAGAVLNDETVPAVAEPGEDSAVVGGVAVHVAGSFPNADGGEVRWLECCDLPLGHGVVGDPIQPDLAVAPRLGGGPLDALVEVLGLPLAQRMEVAGRPSGATHVDPDAHVSVGDPLLGVGQLVDLVLTGGPLEDVGMVVDHLLPGGRHQFFEGEPLAVRTVAGDARVAPGCGRTENVGAQDGAVADLDGHVPLDRHVADHVYTKRALSCQVLGHG